MIVSSSNSGRRAGAGHYIGRHLCSDLALLRLTVEVGRMEKVASSEGWIKVTQHAAYRSCQIGQNIKN